MKVAIIAALLLTGCASIQAGNARLNDMWNCYVSGPTRCQDNQIGYVQ